MAFIGRQKSTPGNMKEFQKAAVRLATAQEFDTQLQAGKAEMEGRDARARAEVS